MNIQGFFFKEIQNWYLTTNYGALKSLIDRKIFLLKIFLNQRQYITF